MLRFQLTNQRLELRNKTWLRSKNLHAVVRDTFRRSSQWLFKVKCKGAHCRQGLVQIPVCLLFWYFPISTRTMVEPTHHTASTAGSWQRLRSCNNYEERGCHHTWITIKWPCHSRTSHNIGITTRASENVHWGPFLLLPHSS